MRKDLTRWPNFLNYSVAIEECSGPIHSSIHSSAKDANLKTPIPI